jgi:glycine/D-amino acid oxidase-like deaminating enzyme
MGGCPPRVDREKGAGQTMAKSAIIIGGGFFGVYLAQHLARQGLRVTLCERGDDIMQRASYFNQARVHNGYHYPRSMLTALRSRVSFPRFVAEFSDCIDRSFEKYYLIGRILSKVSALQYEEFCRRIGALADPAPSRIVRLTNPKLIEAAFSVTEYAFDADKLRQCIRQRALDAGVNCLLRTLARTVAAGPRGLRVTVGPPDDPSCREVLEADYVLNCTYSMINRLLHCSNLELIPLKHEMTEMALVEPPEELRHVGITVMCGPFFSVMPFPPRGLHSFSHVRYTPHYEWSDRPGAAYIDAHEHFAGAPRPTAWSKMLHDARRYLPILDGCKYRDSLWEVKTVLPRSEVDDSRPILFKPNHGLPGLHCIMGGKIDNVYDVLDELQKLGVE